MLNWRAILYETTTRDTMNLRDMNEQVSRLRDFAATSSDRDLVEACEAVHSGTYTLEESRLVANAMRLAYQLTADWKWQEAAEAVEARRCYSDREQEAATILLAMRRIGDLGLSWRVRDGGLVTIAMDGVPRLVDEDNMVDLSKVETKDDTMRVLGECDEWMASNSEVEAWARPLRIRLDFYKGTAKWDGVAYKMADREQDQIIIIASRGIIENCSDYPFDVAEWKKQVASKAA